MSEYIAIDNMSQMLLSKLLPTITLWNRLEGRPRTENFDRTLKAEVRDPLWMLTRQWQIGEFKGDDAGSPVFAKMQMHTTRLTKYAAVDQPTQVFDDSVPLEAKVEQRPLPFFSGPQAISLDLRLQLGRQWLKLVAPAGGFRSEFVGRWKFDVPDPTTEADAQICAHRESWQMYSAVAGRSMDGGALYQHLQEAPGNHSYDGIVGFPEPSKADIDLIEQKFVNWFENLYLQPESPANNAWKPDFLEYQFSCSAPKDAGEQVLNAREYYHGHLDWYNLDYAKGDSPLSAPPMGALPPDPQEEIVRSFIPVPISFDGMPNTRWWTFEDGDTNFGDVQPDTTDINKLLVIEFGLIYANDWFLVPITLDAGSIAKVRGLAVTNVFGERFWIDPAGTGAQNDWQRWGMYTIDTENDPAAGVDPSILILPTTGKIQEGKPIEEVLLIRDEMANMVWAIEQQVPLPGGTSKAGSEAAHELKQHYQKLLGDALASGTVAVPATALMENEAKIRYEVMSSVPENWIPFIPVHMDNGNREIQLQRAAMPRILESNPRNPVKIRPRTILMREGQDETPSEAYFIHEEEVPRAGVRMTQSFQRTRWYGGKVVNWFGIRKTAGRGQGSSGLSFDRLEKK